MDLRLVEYALYLVISVGLTVWVGKALHRNGSRYLAETLKDRALAGSVNQLLVVGFYLVALGGVALLLQVDVGLASAADVIRAVATKVGLVLLLLGALHLVTMLVLSRLHGPAAPAGKVAPDHERLASVRDAFPN